MKLASGFCIPETLPVYTGIKGRQVHPLIRFYAEEPRRVPGRVPPGFTVRGTELEEKKALVSLGEGEWRS